MGKKITTSNKTGIKKLPNIMTPIPHDCVIMEDDWCQSLTGCCPKAIVWHFATILHHSENLTY